MILAVTGTRYGMTSEQWQFLNCLKDWIEEPVTELHHGGCRGVDVQMARMIREQYGKNVWIVCHPGPEGDPNQEVSGVDDMVLGSLNHFARNRVMVDNCDLLLVVPREMEPQARGGTWYTHGYAIKSKKAVKVVYPDGSTEYK